MTKYSFSIIIERDEDSRYVASCPALQGCYSEGETEVEARENLREAIALHIEDRRENGEPIPEEISLETLKIAV